MEACNRAEESGKRSHFPQTWAAVAAAPKQQKAQLARGQRRTAEEHGASQSRKAASMNVISNAVDLVEETRENTVVVSPQALAPRHASSTFGERKPCRTHHTCSSNSDSADGCTAESSTNRGYGDEESGRSRWSGRHLTRVRSDNPSRHTLHTVGW